MALTEQEMVTLALAGIRAQISDLQAKERILEAQFRLKRWGKPKNIRFVKHDEPGLPDITRQTIARTHGVLDGALLEQKEQKKRKRRLSAAGRKAISEAAKARWDRQKAEASPAPKTSGGKKR